MSVEETAIGIRLTTISSAREKVSIRSKSYIECRGSFFDSQKKNDENSKAGL